MNVRFSIGLLVTVLVAPLLFGGCDSVDPHGGPHAEPIKPLAVGNSWTYIDLQYDSERDSADTRSEWTQVIVADTIIGGEKWYQERRLTGGDYSRTLRWYALREDGLWSGNPIFVEDSPFSYLTGVVHLAIPYPASPGMTYEDRHKVEWSVASTDTVITVPAGTFRCHHYQRYNIYSRTYSDFFYAPGVGMVMGDGGALVSYHIHE